MKNLKLKDIYLSLIFLLLILKNVVVAQPQNLIINCGSDNVSNYVPIPRQNPICSDPNTIKYIPIAFHFILSDKAFSLNLNAACDVIDYYGYGNFDEYSDGRGDYTYNGFIRADSIILKANMMLSDNKDQWLKVAGQDYPNPPPKTNIRFILAGVYFHRDSAIYFNNYWLQNPWDIGGTGIIDMYMKPRFYASGKASNLGGGDKYACVATYNTYLQSKCRNWSLLLDAQLVIHEVGHLLNLSHSWYYEDYCEDTKENNNCWSIDANNPNCNTWDKISNNPMSYNQYFLDWGFTKCQIGKMYGDLMGAGNSYIHSCNGCMPSQAFFWMRDTISLCTGLHKIVMLNGQASFNENRFLIEICEQPNGVAGCGNGYFNSGWQQGDVNLINLANFYTFLPNKRYKVKLTVDNTDCPLSDVFERTFITTDCPTPTECCFEWSSTSLTGGHVQVSYKLTQPGNIEMIFVNAITGQAKQLVNYHYEQVGDYQLTDNVSAMPPGSYFVLVNYNGFSYSQTVIKP